ncbi:MAG: radical SAM protein [Planctomycetota bacterium]
MTAIPDLISGGVMLSYRCTNACRHCLYRCSPKRPDEWMSMEMAERVFAALRREPHLQSIHLAGGEATLRFDLLVETVRLAASAGLPLAYLETNAHWCGDREETREKLTRLLEAGTRGVRSGRCARLAPQPLRRARRDAR